MPSQEHGSRPSPLYSAPSTSAQQAMLEKAKAYNKITAPGMPADWAFDNSGQLVSRSNGTQIGTAAPNSAPGSSFLGQLAHASPYIGAAIGMGVLGGLGGAGGAAADLGAVEGGAWGLGDTAMASLGTGAMGAVPVAGAVAAPLASTIIGTGEIAPIAGGTGSAATVPATGTAVTTAGKEAAKQAATKTAKSGVGGMDWSDIALLAAQLGGGALKGLMTPKTGSFADGSDTDPKNIMKYGLDQTKGLFEGLKNNLGKGIDLRSSYAQDVPGLSGSDPALKNSSLLHLNGIDFGAFGGSPSPNMGGANGQGRTPSPAATPIGAAIPKPGTPGANAAGGNDADKAMAALKLMGHA